MPNNTAPNVGIPRFRPQGDTIRHHDCEHRWCGGESNEGRIALECVDWPSGPPVASRWFCSLGCMCRWGAREELRMIDAQVAS